MSRLLLNLFREPSLLTPLQRPLTLIGEVTIQRSWARLTEPFQDAAGLAPFYQSQCKRLKSQHTPLDNACNASHLAAPAPGRAPAR